MAIVLVYEDVLKSMDRSKQKNFNFMHRIDQLLCLNENTHLMVEKVLETFLECSKKKLIMTEGRITINGDFIII